MVAGAIYSALPCGAARFQVPSRLMLPPEPSRMGSTADRGAT